MMEPRDNEHEGMERITTERRTEERKQTMHNPVREREREREKDR